MKFCERKDLVDRQSYVAQYVSLAMLTIGANTLLGSDDLLAAFSCGTAFAWDGFFNKQTEQSVFSSVIDLLFNIAAFVFVGAWMPFGDFSDSALTLSVWRLIVIAILVILLRRLPVMIALFKWIPDVKTLREAFFSGHFGPMGIGTCACMRIIGLSWNSSNIPVKTRCCLHIDSCCTATRTTAGSSCEPGTAPCRVYSAYRRLYGALLHRYPRLIHSLLLARKTCALSFPYLVTP